MADIDAAADTLADAFADYAWQHWTVALDDHTGRIRGLQRLWLATVGVPLGEVWLLRDEGDLLAAVAVWNPPDLEVPFELLAEMEPLVAEFEGNRHGHSVVAEEVAASLRPTGRHYYLGAVGVRPGKQRQGYGMAVLQPTLRRAEADAVDVYLETSSDDNVAFYERLDFVVTGHAAVPGGGPPIWGMTRTAPVNGA